jgi:surfeit locus 1 family protein
MNARRWAVSLAAVLACAGTARLGFWQLDRAAQKTALQAASERQGQLPALTAVDLPAGTLADRPADSPAGAAALAPLWQRRARVEGVWLAAETVYLQNRPMDGRTGLWVLTPLLLDDGRALIVQRGWLPRHAEDRTRIAPYRTPEGRVAVVGRIAASPSRLYELGGGDGGTIRQNLDLADYAREIRRPLLPLVIVEDGSPANAGDGLGRQWPAPVFGVSTHYGYAAQWFGLSALVAVLYVWFQLIHPRRRRP